jgi:hypothetical protein
MTLRGFLLFLVGFACLTVVGVERSAQAQDRGAPRFGPAVPGDTIEAEASDAGRRWSLVAPPVDRFEQRYGMAVDSAWATHLRRSVLRLPNCTASLVSTNGLALTSAECVRRHLETVGEDAVVAEQPDEERPVPGLHADRLVRTRDVTAAVQAVRQDSPRAAVASVQRQLQADAGANRYVAVAADGPEVYTAYTYRRYENVRLAFLPERAVSDFGGIDAAMTYPRQALDVALLRVYTAEGRPLSSERAFDLSRQGVRPGDPVVSVGPAAMTHRAESAEQMAVRRDLMLPERRDRLETWTRAMRAHLDTAEASPEQREGLRDAERILKQIRARLEALQDEYVQTRLERRDARFRRALRQAPGLQDQFGGLLDSLAALQAAKREQGAAYRAFGTGQGGPYYSSTYRRMLRMERPEAASGEASSDSLRTAPVPVETALLADRLAALERHLRPDTAAVRRLLAGQSPDERAAALVTQSTSASAGASSPGAGPEGDPVAEVAAVVRPRAQAVHEEWQRLTRAEDRLTDRLAEARAAVREAPVVPSGDVPRLTDGRVQGYPYNGTTAPPFTTFFGLYEQTHAFGAAAPWTLPERWQPPATGLDRSVPLNLVASVDGTVSNSGTPLLTQSLEVVGVAVGPNIQGVAGTYLFLPERMRTVAVDVRGLREALTAVYGADPLVDELFGGASAPDRR